MVQLDDLNDDCLMQVLDRVPSKELFKLQRLNKQMKRVATIKTGVKFKAITIKESDSLFSSCSHIDLISPDEVFVLKPATFDHVVADLCASSLQSILNLLSKCSGVRAVDFAYCLLNSDTLLEAFRRCPELECVKMHRFYNQGWDRVFDQVGQRIVHLAINWRTPIHRDNKPMYLPQTNFYDRLPRHAPLNLPSYRFLEIVVAKCNNIKRFDWVIDNSPTSDLMAKFKLLPKNCWIRLACHQLADCPFEDVVDELDCHTLNWSQLGHRYDRLSKLVCICIEGFNHGVVFSGLKQLYFNENYQINREFINYFLSSQFPLLEEFSFSANVGNTYDYEAVLQRLTTVKKLIINCAKDCLYKYPKLPQLAVTHRLKKLEAIYLVFLEIAVYWRPNDFLKQVEQYVDEIVSLKKLAFDMRRCENGVWHAAIEDQVKRLKLKQSRVEVVLIV